MTAPARPVPRPAPRVAVVNPAEHRVLVELLRDGPRDREIGRRLGISQDTVRCHVKALLLKTGLPTRTALVVAVLRHRVVVQLPDHVRATATPPAPPAPPPAAGRNPFSGRPAPVIARRWT